MSELLLLFLLWLLSLPLHFARLAILAGLGVLWVNNCSAGITFIFFIFMGTLSF